jgi:hypothetical protein
MSESAEPQDNRYAWMTDDIRVKVDVITFRPTEIGLYIKWKIEQYKRDKWRDDDLWELFVKDFRTFTVDIFAATTNLTIQKLRSYLQSNRV